MKRTVYYLMAFSLLLCLGGCDLIGDIFKGGLIIGLIIAALIIALLVWIFIKAFEGNWRKEKSL